MKRFPIFTLCIASIMSFLLFPSAAYIYTEDPIQDPNEYQMMTDYGHRILGANESTTFSTSSATELPLDKAVRTYILSPEDFLLHAENGTLSQAKEETRYSWEVPVYRDEETGAYQYASFGYLSNGEFEYITCTTPAENYNAQEYLFDPGATLKRLYDAGVGEHADIYVLSLTNIRMSVVIAQENDSFTVLPFAARPDFMELENGEVMSLEQLAHKLESYLNAMNGSNNVPLASGGTSTVTTNHTLWFVLSSVTLCIVIYVGRNVTRRKQQVNGNHKT